MLFSVPFGRNDTGRVGMRNRQKSHIKSKEAMKRDRHDQWFKKRENDLNVIDREKPLPYNLGELFRVNEAKGFIEHTDLRAENRERR